MKIVALGGGRIAELHIENILNNRGFELAGFYEPNNERGQYIENKFKIQQLSLEDIFNDASIKAVIICSPAPTHGELIKQSINAKKEVLCEKPLSDKVEDAKSIVEFLHKKNKKIMLGFNRRFDPAVIKLQNNLREGKIGNLENLKVISRDPYSPPLEYLEKCGGVFFDTMIHDFDMVRFLTKQKITKLFATGANLFDENVGKVNDYDTAFVYLEVESKAMLQINVSRRCSYGYDQRIEAFGALGKLYTENVHENGLIKATKDGFVATKLKEFFLERYQQSYKNILDEFLNSYNGNRDYEPNEIDGLKSMELAEIAHQSIAQNKPIMLEGI